MSFSKKKIHPEGNRSKRKNKDMLNIRTIMENAVKKLSTIENLPVKSLIDREIIYEIN